MGMSPQKDNNEARWCVSLTCVCQTPRRLEEMSVYKYLILPTKQEKKKNYNALEI